MATKYRTKPREPNGAWYEVEVIYFTLNGSDHPSHAAQEHAIAGYIRWKNKRA